jgi:hypothetical protein
MMQPFLERSLSSLDRNLRDLGDIFLNATLSCALTLPAGVACPL